MNSESPRQRRPDQGELPPWCSSRITDKMAPSSARPWRAWFGWRNLRPASTEHVAEFGPLLSALRWVALSLALALGADRAPRAARRDRRGRARRVHAVADRAPIGGEHGPVADHRRVAPRGGGGRGRGRGHRLRPLPVPHHPGRRHRHRRVRRRPARGVGAGGHRRAGRGAAERAPGLAPRPTPTRACSSPSSSSSSAWRAASAATSWRSPARRARA